MRFPDTARRQGRDRRPLRPWAELERGVPVNRQIGLGAGRAVAVKVVHARYADKSEFRARCRQEIAAARRVSGPGIFSVADVD